VISRTHTNKLSNDSDDKKEDDYALKTESSVEMMKIECRLKPQTSPMNLIKEKPKKAYEKNTRNTEKINASARNEKSKRKLQLNTSSRENFHSRANDMEISITVSSKEPEEIERIK
jgi:hypothetical protein